ncbi:MAG: Uncharacterized protein G01um10147_262 [Microgenomates group bacterium Gr01-1014_7]|nr:MAG: Uncharacterized protein G01um10147_262 [Microgenomates group bacterium Gr01-1014_7]
MTRIIVKGLVWDSINLEHVKKHNVSKEEVEGAKEIIYHRRTYGGKYLATSRSGNRLITIILRRQGLGKYYVVTARDASRKERRKVYEIEEKQNS